MELRKPMDLRKLIPVLVAALVLAACGQQHAAPGGQPGDSSGGSRAAGPGEADTLRLIAGSEVKDLEPLLAQMRSETGVAVSLTYSGTLDGIERVLAGEPFDGAWFSHAKYMMLMPGAAARVRAAEKIMLSPVVLGVKEDRARALGWGPTTPWATIAREAGQGRFRFAMTNPAASNSGFSALVGVAASFAGKSDALEIADLQRDKMALLFKGQALASGSSGWLAERYVQEQDSLDGIVNYESVLLSLNRGGQLRQRLTLVYPRDGVLTADYPLLLFNDAKRAAYDKAVAWLKGEKAQAWIMAQTLRRPVNAAVPVDRAIFGDNMVVDMAFPGKLAVVDALLATYLGEARRPASMYFVLDLSGSMAGARIEGLRRALYVLAGQDGQSLTGSLAALQPRERVTMIPFSSRVHADQVLRLEVSRTNPRDSLAQLSTYAGSLSADGGTALYDAVATAYQLVAADQARDPERYYTVVVMTDGQSNVGSSASQFRGWLLRQPPAVRNVKAFPVLFGEGDIDELNGIAQLTGGRVFDSGRTTLAALFKEIRGYQ